MSNFLNERSFSGGDRRSKKSSVASLGQLVEQPVIDIRIKGRSGFSNPDIKISPRGSTAGNGTPSALQVADIAKEIQVALAVA